MDRRTRPPPGRRSRPATGCGAHRTHRGALAVRGAARTSGRRAWRPARFRGPGCPSPSPSSTRKAARRSPSSCPLP